MDEEGQRAAATIESLSITRDGSDQLLGNPSLFGLQQHSDDGLWDNISYATNTEDAFINLDDDILTLNIPPVDSERTANFANILFSQLDNQDASLSNCGVDASSEINIDSLKSVPISALRPETDALQLEFDVTVERGCRSAYIFKHRSLFARMNTNVKFAVNCPVLPPPKSFIRICAVYSENVYANVPVRRCHHHRSLDSNQEEHFLIVTNNSEAQHLTEKVEGEEGLRSFVIVPFDALHINTRLTLQFRCYSSCPGGINRRQVVLCFSLENG
ncbi:unnamed protein product [Onchocerca ochengi]|uniref:P53 domain-containing protein n=1 Tax=Onchocerca ochengi TaxID=42157 RepID=A0A182ELX1_ONCOC|nr:unnamed protein product [Onchocerca ochengi]